MAAALKEKGYDHKFVFGEGAHNSKHGASDPAGSAPLALADGALVVHWHVNCTLMIPSPGSPIEGPIMSKKNHAPGPVPAGNKPKHGPDGAPPIDDEPTEEVDVATGFNEEDPKRRLGNHGGAGEHPRQEYGRNRD